VIPGAECTALINGSIGSRGTVDPRAFRDLAVVGHPEVTVRTRRSMPAA
jgi:hypothetical protein